METINNKNMVILRNLPSNLIKETYVVLKSRNQARKLQKIENARTKQQINKKDEYIVKEAEMLVEEYVNKIQNQDKKVIVNLKNKKSYKRLKTYSFISSIIIILQILLLIIK